MRTYWLMDENFVEVKYDTLDALVVALCHLIERGSRGAATVRWSE